MLLTAYCIFNMKVKFLIIIMAGALALSGCATSNTVNVKLQTKSFSTTTTETTKPATQSINQSNQNQMSIAPEKQQENLAAIYKGAILKTNFGDITVEFYGDESPITVTNFLKLSSGRRIERRDFCVFFIGNVKHE